ncbi:MAG TPA: SdrD B-like domain-containing protein, partial [Bacteroidia bacterium]|nr:SdrD B-like domain-containing protein [Bacteroidia bacterium]
MKNFYLLIILSILVSFTSKAQITGMSATQGCPGQTLQTTISSNGMFLQSSSPAGNIYSLKLKKSGFAPITIFDWNNWWDLNTQVINADTVNSQFVVNSINLGLYDLEVIIGDVLYPYLNQNTYTLPSAFTVVPPDGTISGTIYHDLNNNGIKDGGEPAISNRIVRAVSWSTNTTDINGDYSFDVANGTYSLLVEPSNLPYMFVTSNPDTIQATINNNNSAGNDFGLRHALTSVTPNVGFKGLPGIYQITSAYPIFQPGINANGNVSSITFLTLPNTHTVYGSNFITVIDSFTIQFQSTFPINTNNGSNLDIRVNTSGTYSGTHFLTGQFNVIDAPYYITGSMFFDQNQNKIKDVGEPGINNAQVQITPTSSFAFTNASGDFLLGSLGGAQTLTPDLNIPGLSLFTDSASYTLNVTGNISGKDFGFISNAPDYSILVKDLYVFARCNTNQYVSFKVRNNSSIAYDTKVWLKYDDALMNYISSLTPPSSVSNDTIYWDINNFLPYTEVEFKALFGLPGAGTSMALSSGASSLDGSGVVQLTAYENKHI